MAKPRDEEFNFCNKIVILNVTVLPWLWLCASEGVIITQGREVRGKATQSEWAQERESDIGLLTCRRASAR